MVIDTNSINSSGSAASARSRASTHISSGTTKTPSTPNDAAIISSKDNVVLSQEAQSLSRLQAKISSSPDVDLERVAAIKLAIAEGRFEINPDRIAENMLKQDEFFN